MKGGGKIDTPGLDTPAFTRVTEGGTLEGGNDDTCERLGSKAECEKAAEQLGLTNTVASEETKSDMPPYCYYKGDKLWFNYMYTSYPSTFPPCDNTNVCICEATSGRDRVRPIELFCVSAITMGSPKIQTKRAVRVKMVKLDDFARKFRKRG